MIFYESPHRIEDTLNLLYKELGDRKVVLHRELTKINEEKIYGTLSELVHLDFSLIKGELVIVVEGNTLENSHSDSEIQIRVASFMEKGLSKKDAIELTCEVIGVKKNYVKDLIK